MLAWCPGAQRRRVKLHQLLAWHLCRRLCVDELPAVRPRLVSEQLRRSGVLRLPCRHVLVGYWRNVERDLRRLLTRALFRRGRNVMLRVFGGHLRVQWRGLQRLQPGFVLVGGRFRMHAVQRRRLQLRAWLDRVHGVLGGNILDSDRRELVGNVQELPRRHILLGPRRVHQCVHAVQRRHLLRARLVLQPRALPGGLLLPRREGQDAVPDQHVPADYGRHVALVMHSMPARHDLKRNGRDFSFRLLKTLPNIEPASAHRWRRQRLPVPVASLRKRRPSLAQRNQRADRRARLLHPPL